MQGWRSEWQAISARIVGTVELGAFILGTGPAAVLDPANIVDGHLLFEACAIRDIVVAFGGRHASSLPPEAQDAVRRFAARPESIWSLKGNPGFRKILAVLSAFRLEFDYLTANGDAPRRRLAERAFIHLQQSIVADDALRVRWCAAFAGSGETACERLGAVHLLSHGIWSFKAHGPGGAGGRTDLVLAGPVEAHLAQIEEAADALVLTEWKVAKSDGEVDEKVEQAIRQAQLYSAGILAAVELTSTRYAVIVTEKQITPRPARREGEIEYRIVNVAVDPDSPSVAARA